MDTCLNAAGDSDDKTAPLFHSARNNLRGRAITKESVYKMLAWYTGMVGIDIDGFAPNALRAAAITSALEHDAALEKVQDWVDHVNISTRMYDPRELRAEDSPLSKSRTKSDRRHLADVADLLWIDRSLKSLAAKILRCSRLWRDLPPTCCALPCVRKGA